MITNTNFIEVRDIKVELVRKTIKNLHLGVYPPDGHVRVAVPEHINDEYVRLAIISRLAWIRRHQRQMQEQIRESKREMISGESHYYRGRRYLLEVVEGKKQVRLNGKKIELQIPSNSNRESREKAVYEWYRKRMKSQIPKLISKWEKIMGVKVDKWQIRKMRTLWGSCNPATGSIILNLELIKKAPQCLEYILVHEMVHLMERHHNERFRQLMNKFMPQWQLHRKVLNDTPLAYEDWKY